MVTTNRNAIGAVLIAALIWFGGCTKDESDQLDETAEPASQGCLEDEDCQSTERCLYRICSILCEQDSDCATGATCQDTGRGKVCARVQDNACSTTEDCPVGTKCIYQRCAVECDLSAGVECPSGKECIDGFCLGDEIPTDTSVTDSGASNTSKDAASGTDSGQSVQDGGTKAEVCSPNSVKCQDNKVVSCNADGKSQTEQVCPYICLDGQCAGSCTPELKKCEELKRLKCDTSGQWQVQEECAAVCTPDACATSCNEGDHQCNESILMVCKDGIKFVEEETCDYVCRNNACTGECEPGTKQCSLGARRAGSCGSDGRWDWISCEDGCVDGACRTECSPGNKRCVGENGAREICGDDGRWAEAQACSNQACVQGECKGSCTPGATKCENKKSLRTCDDNGDWGQARECENQACIDNVCKGNCAPDQLRCKPNSAKVIQECSDSGAWEDDTTCSSSQVCGEDDEETKCVTGCAPYDRRCVSDTPSSYQVCNPDSTWGNPQTCANNNVCADAGICVCPSGKSPRWSAGGGQSVNDPLWETAPLVNFASANQSQRGQYRILLDRAGGEPGEAAGELAVQIRVSASPRDTATLEDRVFFGISVDGDPAQAITIQLVGTSSGSSDPRALTVINKYKYSSGGNPAWSAAQSDPFNWFSEPVAWVATSYSVNGVSWAVSFRVNLDTFGIEDQEPFRAAVGMNIAGTGSAAPVVLSTPAVNSFINLYGTTLPSTWFRATPPRNVCVANVPLSQ